MTEIYAIAVFSALLAGFCQVLLKKGSSYGADRNSLLLSYWNGRTISGCFLMFVVTLLNVYVYQTLPLKTAVMIMPLTYIAVALLSVRILREQLSRIQYAGMGLILIGIVIFNLQ